MTRGIAELLAIRSDSYQLIFYPGNIEFSLKFDDLPTNSLPGTEFKASYEALIQGSEECSRPSPQLIGLPH